MLKLSDIGLREQLFTHVYEGVATMLAVERIAKSPEYLALPVVITPVEEQFAKWCMEHRGIEQHRLARISAVDLITQPLMYCEFPRPESLGGGIAHLLVDGNHRFVKAAMLGLSELPARIAPETLWRQFQVTDIPLDLAEAFVESESGIS